MDLAFEQSVMRKVAWRLVPFLSFAYMINALDRFNISIAALTMNKSLGLSATAYGLAAGAFFWSYCLFQIPANMVMTRVGARRWITIIMIVWGAASAGTAFVTDLWSFVGVRFLLGVAESGFFPGVAYFMTRWFPSRHRGRAMGVFYAFGAGASVIGGPLSGNILLLDGWMGLHGWQWIFLIEGIPAVLLAALCPFVMYDRPADAGWLNTKERDWLEARMLSEAKEKPGQHLTLLRSMASRIILTLTLIYTVIGFGVYSKNFFLPLMIKGMGFTDLSVSYLSALPNVFGVLGMILFSRSSDRTGERVWHVVVPCLCAGVGMVSAGLTLGTSPVAAIASLCLAAFGISGSLPVFWNLPTAYLGAGAAAGGIAFINSVGNISGYVAPQFVGLVRDATGNYELAMMVVGGVVLLCGLMIPLAVGRALAPAETAKA